MCTRRLVGRMCTVNATHGTRYAVNTLTHTQWTCTIFNNMKINMLFTVLFSMKRKGMPKALLYMQVHVCVCVSWVCVWGGIHVCMHIMERSLSWVQCTLSVQKPFAVAHHNLHTYIITHLQWRRASHPHIRAHTHTHIVLGTYSHHLHNICTHTHGQCIQTCLHSITNNQVWHYTRGYTCEFTCVAICVCGA